LLDIN
ncbi:DNA-directed RNA polymerase 7 kDa subunit, partial [Monkeypox virus]